MSSKILLTVIGFLLFFFGCLALILSLVNLKLSFLSFIDKPSPTFGFVVRLFMIFGGLVMFYIGRTDNSID